jgi:hypothetical protein
MGIVLMVNVMVVDHFSCADQSSITQNQPMSKYSRVVLDWGMNSTQDDI